MRTLFVMQAAKILKDRKENKKKYNPIGVIWLVTSTKKNRLPTSRNQPCPPPPMSLTLPVLLHHPTSLVCLNLPPPLEVAPGLVRLNLAQANVMGESCGGKCGMFETQEREKIFFDRGWKEKLTL